MDTRLIRDVLEDASKYDSFIINVCGGDITLHPDIDGIIDGLKAHDIEKVASSMGNVLEKVTIEEYPVIEQIKNVMKEQGALNAMMSGSGPTVFGIYDSKEKARKAAAKIREKQLAKQVYVTGIHNARRK